MSKNVDILRSLVNERLTAAAEEIFALVERTIVEYEEELCRSKEENQRKQQLLDSVLNQHTTQDENTQEEDFGPSLKEEPLELAEFEDPEPRMKWEAEQRSHWEPEPRVKWELEPRVQREPEPRIKWEPETRVQREPEQSQIFPPNLDYAKAEMIFDRQQCSRREEQTELFHSENDPGESSQKWEAPIEDDWFDKEKACVNALENCDALTQSTKHKQKRCSVCEKLFRTNNDLKRHMVVHTGEKPYSCSVCGKRFTRKGSMQIHMVVHSGARPCRCSVCGRTFLREGNLRAHMVLHSGDKPHSCTECGARFSTLPPLIRHRKLHTGDRPFSCPFCSRGFTRNEHLRRHVQTHKAS